MSDDLQRESLSKEADHVLEEARMILPGIQALFGFQWVAVFSNRFVDLPAQRQELHLAALFAVAVAIALIMTPAIYHRQVEPHSVSRGFITLATRCLMAASIPLLVGIGLEFYVVARLIAPNALVGGLLTALLLTIFVALWFALPRLQRYRNLHISS